jgi:hypothetical protein
MPADGDVLDRELAGLDHLDVAPESPAPWSRHLWAVT